MGFSRKRTGTGGRVRYTAIYRDLRGRQRSAGSFATRREADRAWQRAEVMLGLGRVGDPARGRQTFERYVEDTWFPNHQVEVTTRQVYWYCLRKHILPEFGPMKMVEILPEHVREWVTKMKDSGLSPALIAGNKVILSGIFTTALNDQITFLHPCKGVKTPTVPVKPLHDHHAGAVQRRVRGAAGPDVAAAGGDRHRERAALGRADRTASARHRVRFPHAHCQPDCRPGIAEVPSNWWPVPGEGLPQGPGVPALQAQRPDRREAAGARGGARPWAG